MLRLKHCGFNVLGAVTALILIAIVYVLPIVLGVRPMVESFIPEEAYGRRFWAPMIASAAVLWVVLTLHLSQAWASCLDQGNRQLVQQGRPKGALKRFAQTCLGLKVFAQDMQWMLLPWLALVPECYVAFLQGDGYVDFAEKAAAVRWFVTVYSGLSALAARFAEYGSGTVGHVIRKNPQLDNFVLSYSATGARGTAEYKDGDYRRLGN